MKTTRNDEDPKGNKRVRANGEGAIYKRPDGRWTARLTLEGGKRKDFYGKTREEVNRKLTQALSDQQKGLPVVGERMTVGQFLTDWLATVKVNLKPKTYVTYEGLIRLHVMPRIGKVVLSRLTPQQLQKVYAEASASGLSAQSVRHINAVIHKALELAFHWNLVAMNVAERVELPKVDRHEMKTLNREQALALLEAASGDRLEAFYVLAVTTGMRLGELLALRWQDVDLEAGTVSVRGTLNRSKEGLVVGEPKTKSSRRNVMLPQLAVEALRRHKINQNADRLLRGDAWLNKDMVFANEVGKPIEDSNLRRRSFEPLLKKAGLPHIRFHDLRHTAATLLLGQGIHPKIVSERLGHSRVGVTLDLYSHVTPTMQQQAADAMESLLRA